jgi:hypothetical protein
MFARIYLILGAMALVGYSVAAYEGWEFVNPVRLAAAPPAGAAVHSSGGRWFWFHSSSSSGGRGIGVGGFGGK